MPTVVQGRGLSSHPGLPEQCSCDVSYTSYEHCSCIHTSPALNGRSVLQPFKCGNLIKITNRMFDFYPGIFCIHALAMIMCILPNMV